MVDPHKDGATGVAAAGCGPLPGDADEVPGVESDQDSVLQGGEVKQLLVSPAVKVALFAGRPHVMAKAP